MKNIKDKVFSALEEKFENVTRSYPSDWKKLPVIQLTEEENKVYERTDKEEKEYVLYKIDVWHNRSTSPAALKVDETICKKIGLIRTGCTDTPDPSGMEHKVMRYEGIIDMNSDMVYWT